jgi:hypothetical protein
VLPPPVYCLLLCTASSCVLPPHGQGLALLCCLSADGVTDTPSCPVGAHRASSALHLPDSNNGCSAADINACLAWPCSTIGRPVDCIDVPGGANNTSGRSCKCSEANAVYSEGGGCKGRPHNIVTVLA